MAYGPILLANIGDQYTKTCVIDCVVVKGMSDIGNVYAISDAVNSAPLIDTTGSTIGPAFYPFVSGINAPNGFKLTAKTAALTVYVYIR